jgi:hypothetical protein
MNKVVPELEVVVNSKTPAPTASEAIIIPLNLTGAAILLLLHLQLLLILLLVYRLYLPCYSPKF